MATSPLPKKGRCLAVLIRHPEAGKVKTRLAKSCGEDFAAELYGHFVDDLLQTLAGGDYHLEIFFAPAEKGSEVRQRFGARFSYSPQRGEDLGERMEDAFRRCSAKGFSTTVLIGSDCPDLDRALVEEAFLALEQGHDAAVGPALDGGYYLIGFRADAFAPGVFRGMVWGGDSVFEQTLARLRASGALVYLGPAWLDIDTGEDLEKLEKKHGDTAFSRSRTMAFLRRRSGMFQSD